MGKEIDFLQVSLKVILKNRQGEVLILRGAPGTLNEGWWDFPGGRINTDEARVPIPEIIAREILEEAGDINYTFHYAPVALGRREVAPEFTSTGKVIRQIFIFFEADYHSGTIQLSEEHTEYKWIDMHKVPLEEYFTSGLLEGVGMYRDKK